MGHPIMAVCPFVKAQRGTISSPCLLHRTDVQVMTLGDVHGILLGVAMESKPGAIRCKGSEPEVAWTVPSSQGKKHVCK